MSYTKPSSAYMADRCRGGRSPRKSPDTLLRQARCDSSLKSIAFGAVHSRRMSLLDLGSLIAPLGFTFLLLAGVAWAFWDYNGLPTVYQSHMTRECVRVEQMDGTPGDCSNLPDRYHHVWVK